MRILIVGAGPIGLEAAVAALDAGARVTLVERDQLGGNVLRWGHVRFFSPWRMDTSPRGLRVLDALGRPSPDPDAYPTGREFWEQYLAPLGEYVRGRADVHEGTEVCSIGRVGVLKTEAVGSSRTGLPFRVLVSDAAGVERMLEADAVVDCSGTYGNPNHLGPGGVPTVGERALRGRIEYVIPDVLGVDRARYANHHTLLVGSGYSAATTLSLLLGLREHAPETRVTWVTRYAGLPYARIEDDILASRDELASMANELTRTARVGVRYIGASEVAALEASPGGGFLVTLLRADGHREVVDADNVVANVGYRPDLTLHRELHVSHCPLSEGSVELAASPIGSSADHPQPTDAPDELPANPEPGFFVLGSKSYGRNSRFLLRVGLEQVDTMLGSLGLAPAQPANARLPSNS